MLRPGPPGGGVRKLGLENKLGSNHCFLNVVIQAFWNLQAFRTRLLAEPHHANRTSCKCCYCELKALFHEYSVSEANCLPPDGLRRALSSVYLANGRFKAGDMEDASETLDALLGILHACHLEQRNSVPSPIPAPQIQLDLSHVEKAGTFGCHPLCFAHDIFGIEYVDVPHCTFCGATGEPSMCSSFLYTTYASELLAMGSRSGSCEEEFTTDPIGVLQDMLTKATSRFSGPPASLPDLLRALGQGRQQPCIDCKSSKIHTERWLTRKPRIFTISLVWPNSTAFSEDIWLILCMLKPRLKMEQIFKVAPPADDVSYCFHGMICYKTSQHYVAVFWCHSSKRWTFFDDRLVQEQEDWLQVANLLLQDGYMPTLIFYERDCDVPPSSLEELERQVQQLQDQASCAAM